jgi:hypothetical protein
MTNADDLANRHSLPAGGLREAADASALAVHIVVSDQWASAPAGQLLTSCLVNMLCRQAGAVAKIAVTANETPVAIWLPNLGGAGAFPHCLKELAFWAVGDAVPVTTDAGQGPWDCTIYVGLKPNASTAGGIELVALGDGWRAWIGEPQNAPAQVLPTERNALGPFLAAALAAGETFKRSRGILRGRYLDANGYSLWTGETSSSWDDLNGGPSLENLALAPLHIAGVGAVGNDLAYCIASTRPKEAYVILIDDDTYDTTNLNRCLLAGTEDVEDPKVWVVERALRSANVGVFPFDKTIKDYVAEARIGLREDIAARVNDLEFGIVASCVDKGGARQDVQGLSPELLAGGSTLGMRAQSNMFGLRPDGPCLACHNPAEPHGERLHALGKELRNMAAGDRVEFLLKHGLDVDAVEEYLKTERCGSLGEKALRDFATRSANEFSVSFVSLGAALLLYSTLLRHTAFAAQAPARNDELTALNFLNGGLGDTYVARDPNCELRCFEKKTKANA